jgi:RNase P subunit RPR2
VDLSIVFTENKIDLFCTRCQKSTQHFRFEEDPRIGRIVWTCSVCKKKKATNIQGVERQEEVEIFDEDDEGKNGEEA